MWRGLKKSAFSRYTSPSPRPAGLRFALIPGRIAALPGFRPGACPLPPPPAAALSMTGYPILDRNLDRFFKRCQPAGNARHERNPGFPSPGAPARLGSHHFIHRRRRRPDELHARPGAGLGKARVLGKKSVTGMDGLCPAAFRRVQNLRDVQIRFRGRGWPNRIGLIRSADVHRRPVSPRNTPRPAAIPSSRQARITRSRDLPPIGNQNLLEHDAETMIRKTLIRKPGFRNQMRKPQGVTPDR